MSTAVAITDEICRTVLYLAGIGAFIKVAPSFLPRVQIAAAKNPPRTPDQPAQAAVSEAQASSQEERR